jgi:hypothetical protein
MTTIAPQGVLPGTSRASCRITQARFKPCRRAKHLRPRDEVGAQSEADAVVPPTRDGKRLRYLCPINDLLIKQISPGGLAVTQLEELLTTADVARITRAPESTVRYWRCTGVGPTCFKLGRRVLYQQSDVEAWLADQRRENGPRRVAS